MNFSRMSVIVAATPCGALVTARESGRRDVTPMRSETKTCPMPSISAPWTCIDTPGVAADSPLGRLVDLLRDRGIERVVLQPARERAAETMCVGDDEKPMLVWAPGPNYLVGLWQVIGSVSDPEGAADRIASLLVGDGR